MREALFDDHSEALALWREHGLSGLTCLHIDAHLDVMEDGFNDAALAGIAAARTGEELRRFRGVPDLPWGGLHCGNYLFPALLDGTVTTLIWLLPREVIANPSWLEGVRQQVQSGVDLTFAEYQSFHLVDGRVEAILRGRRLVACTWETMPPLGEAEQANLALDVDVDYFVRLRDDRIWQTPHELQVALGPLKPLALTVALSCEGGYTPVSLRFLGQVCLDVFAGRPDPWRGELAALRRAQGEGAEALRALLDNTALLPRSWRPAVLSLLGRTEEAAELDPAYREEALNLASRCLQKGDFEAGLTALQGGGELDSTRILLEGFLTAGRAEPQAAREQLSVLLASPGLSGPQRARLWKLQSEMQARAGSPQDAMRSLKLALKLEPERPDLHHMLALQQRDAGERQAAARSLRRALKSARGKMSSLPMLLDAFRLYSEMGEPALARAVRQELVDSDVTGQYALASSLARVLPRTI